MRIVENRPLEVRLLGGLVLDTEPLARPPNTWARLENFDLLIPGSIRKIEGFAELLLGKTYDSIIGAIRTYRRSVGDARIVLGISVAGFIYNLETGDALGRFPVVNYPFVGQMPGLDGPDTINYLITTTAGYYPYKWDGQTDPTIVGVTSPVTPVIIGSMVSREREDFAIFLLVGRQYRWTYWNPVTRHESSPSPLSALATIGPSYFFNVPTDQPFITSIQLFIYPDAPARGDGYTRKRVYATRDGGETFFLVRDLFEVDAIGNITGLPDDDGAVSLSATFILHGISGFFPGIVKTDNGHADIGQIISGTPTLAGGQVAPVDTTLVEPGPLDGENNPPPPAIWGAIYQNRAWFVDADNPLNLVYSKIGGFQSYPADNVFPVPSDDLDFITALRGQEHQLIVGKNRGSQRIIGTDFTDFVLTPLDPQIGFEGRRALTESEGGLFFLSQQGIMVYTGSLSFYGKPIRKITDLIPEASKLELVIAEVFSKRSLVLFAIGNQMIGMNISEPSPFFLITGLPADVASLAEVENAAGEVFMCFGANNCKVYRLFIGGNFEALAETQSLPQAELMFRKIFRRLKVEGFIADGFEVAFKVDDRPQTAFVPLREEVPIGLVGKQLIIQFRHKVLGDAILSNFTFDYALLGESR